MLTTPTLPPALDPLPADGPRRLSPTDVSQFIRLEQCERYLRLQLTGRARGQQFLREYDVAPQAMTPLLTVAGRDFEERVEGAVRGAYRTVNLAANLDGGIQREPDNGRVVEAAAGLPAGETLVLFQPRLVVEVAGWQLRGDADIVRLERDAAGGLHVLITDMKSSAAVRVEHRLQVAFYHTMLAQLFDAAGVAYADMGTAILYRGVDAAHGPTATPRPPAEEAERERQRDAARRLFGVEDALLSVVTDAASYLEAVEDLVTGPGAAARRVAEAPFEALPYHLTYKCDGCLFNEFCMRWSAEHDDLSLLPHLTAQDKLALHKAGVTTMRELATVKQFAPGEGEGRAGLTLQPAPGQEERAARLAVAWPVGPRVDELVHRARRYRKWKGDPLEYLPFIPSKGYSSLPYSDAEHNPNLVRVYIDAQHDYLHDRVYMLGALVVGCEGGQEVPQRRRSIVHVADGPPDTEERERDLFIRWTRDVIAALVQVAAPDAEGKPNAPIHLVFFDSYEQRVLLDGLARHASALLGTTPLYDFVTQLAAFDSPIASFLDREIREHKNYPMVCQSLQAVAAYLNFDWNQPAPYRDLFKLRLFDFWGQLDAAADRPKWYFNRARFSSQVPLEYAYGAWGKLPPDAPGVRPNEMAAYRAVTLDRLAGFQARRLEAMERVAQDFAGNRYTEKRLFELPDLAQFEDRAQTLAHALDEFLVIERHVDLNAWKATRLLPAERRALLGETLVVRYVEADQPPEVAAAHRENERRRRLRAQYEAEYMAAHPEADKPQLSREQKAASDWSPDGLPARLRLETAGLDCDLDTVLALSTLRDGEQLVLFPFTVVDERLPVEERTENRPTAKQMLYGPRVALKRLVVERDGQGRAVSAVAEVEYRSWRANLEGFTFSAREWPPIADQVYTLDTCPNNIYGYWCRQVVKALCAAEEGKGTGRNTLYERMTRPTDARVDWPAEAAAGQARFLAGLDALCAAGALHSFEPSKREYIGGLGDAPILLVQGPPGTGKSYSTAFALFARMQGAMAAGRPFRAFVTCKTHAATDVLLQNVAQVQAKLAALRAAHPALFDRYLDARLLDAPLFRVAGRETPPNGVIALPKDRDRAPGQPYAADAVVQPQWCIVAATPGGVHGMVTGKWKGKSLFGHQGCDCLVLDEASQMNLPEAAMAALMLRREGQLVVVGDHRQMPPIVKHDWDSEPRRTFQAYRTYESLFATLLPLASAMVKFEESFRLHAAMAEFLRREVYYQDGIRYHSRRQDVLPVRDLADDFVAAVLSPAHPLVVVVHEEADSQVRNPFEQQLVGPMLEALADPALYGLDAAEGLGVVVPHRAQRAALQDAFPCLRQVDPATGTVRLSAVDTVERFQGGERTAIVLSATESHPQYLLASSQFLLDPRRLTVALSRAKRKMVLVASRSVFSLFSPDEETFAHAQLWKNLLRATCTEKLWAGERHGHRVEVWGNATP